MTIIERHETEGEWAKYPAQEDEISTSSSMLFFLFALTYIGVRVVIQSSQSSPTLKQQIITSNEKHFSYGELLTKARTARTEGSVRVIIRLRVPSKSEGELSPQDAQAKRTNINQARRDLLAKLSPYNASVVADSDQWVIPYVALKIDENALKYLIASPEVEGISEDTENEFSPAVINSSLSKKIELLLRGIIERKLFSCSLHQHDSLTFTNTVYEPV